MLLKLAARNIRRSVRDYAIYFVTLVFGVAVFYAFNSIGGQQILFDLETANADMFDTTQDLLSGFSVVIAFVLGFLIVYANRFLIKRRKHEFGIYLTLGMGPGEVSRIVLYETVIVGLVSLAVGLVCGILLAQALSFVTAGLFNVQMTQYQFTFSGNACAMTLVCFAAIYVVVALFNLGAVRRYKLIDLISAKSKNEKSPVRNPWVCLTAFIASVGILGVAYWLLNENGLVMLDDPKFAWATVLMLVGSLLFFWSLAGFAIAVLTRARGVYLRGLAMFTVRQIASKVNTAFVSLWAVCVLLFFSITTFSTGMGLIEVFCGGIEKAAPYSATIRADVYYEDLDALVHPDSSEVSQRAEAMAQEYPDLYAEGQSYNWDIAAKMRDAVPNWDEMIATSAQIDEWEIPGKTYGSLLASVDEADLPEGLNEDYINANNIGVVSISQYNALLELAGSAPVQLADDECLMLNNLNALDGIVKGILENVPSIDMMGHDLRLQSEVRDTQLMNNAMSATSLVFVVPDYVVEELRADGAIPLVSYLNMTYATDDAAAGDEALVAALTAAFPAGSADALENGYVYSSETYTRTIWPLTSIYTHHEMVSQASGLRMMITYLALYIGFIFLVTTAAVLAIQQLSEAADSQPRYRLLAKLGCDERMLNCSLFVQVLVYFLAPLLLAACHSACAIHVLSKSLFDALGTPVQGPILMAAGFTLLIYGGYFLITYFASRSIMRQAVKG
ncbi:MAG: FtsX-like permease family protein [Eggerthellaceae bacterium]|nr:FtsX-like permease family protein [Eggerthellaceae bacterium]